MEKVTPIFVVGCPRAGTTLIGNLLASSNKVCNLGEYGAFYLTYFLIEHHYLKRYPSRYKDDYIKELKEHAKTFAIKIAVQNNCNYYSDSSPANLLISHELASTIPEAQFVLVLRHYTGVLQSLERSFADGYSWAGNTWKKRAHIWRTFYAYTAHLPKDRTTIISYDKLCANPKTTLSDFYSNLQVRGINIYDLDERVLANSYATEQSRNRKTIGILTKSNRLLLKPIQSFNSHEWTHEIESEIFPEVSSIDNLLKQLFKSQYINPTDSI